MLKILYKNGALDSEFKLPENKINLDERSFVQDGLIKSLIAGRLVTVDGNANVKLADGASDIPLGVLVNDAAGYVYENVPALASGRCPAMQGGGLIVTDQVVEDNIVPGDKLYCGTGANNGMFTKTSPVDGAMVVGIAREANSTADKSLKIHLYV
jgi:hypothetical protein